MATTLSRIAAILRQQTKQQDLTQEVLRKSAGISRQTLTNVLSGNSDFKVTTLIAIADRLGLDVILLPKAAARGLADELAPRPPVVKTTVQAALERLHERSRTR
ncbi:helix-turn-helix transcriptional regulator [Alcaligenaceae bacterium]|nr:helix-turn-helix transcriptional regulator [Alcaligenaceae bacterium]